MGIPVNRVTQIMRDQRGVSADTVLRRAGWFGTSPGFWMGLQSDDELRCAQRYAGRTIAHRLGRGRLNRSACENLGWQASR